MEQFLEFVDRKQREAKKHLNLIERLLRKGGMEVYSHLEDEEPYIFVKSPSHKVSFDGLRIYEIGQMVAYRVQKEEKTQPYGRAYMLDIEDMFNDFMSENMEEDEAGKRVVESVVKELKKFFAKSAEAERDMKGQEQDGMGIILKTGGSDYSSMVTNKL
jgi:hypothetical protein